MIVTLELAATSVKAMLPIVNVTVRFENPLLEVIANTALSPAFKTLLNVPVVSALALSILKLLALSTE